MAVLATDNFNRANGGLGANWTAGNGALTIFSNQVGSNTSSAHTFAHWNAVAFPAGQYAQIKLSSFAGTTVKGIGVSVRGATNNAYSFKALTNVLSYQLVRSTGGTAVQIGTNAQDPVANDVLKLTAQSTTLTCEVNGITVITTTDANFATGSAGVAGYDIYSGGSGNLLGDDWEGGNLLPEPTRGRISWTEFEAPGVVTVSMVDLDLTMTNRFS